MFSCGLGPNEGGPHMQSVCKIYKYDKTYNYLYKKMIKEEEKF